VVRELAEIALREVGVIEIGGNNRGVRVEEYQRARAVAGALTPATAASDSPTGPAGKRESDTGDGVWRKKRSRSVVRSLIRLK